MANACEPCSQDVEAEEDVFVVEQAAARLAPAIPASAEAGAAPPPFDLADEEPPFDAPDPDDEIFQPQRQTLDLDAGDVVDGHAVQLVAPESAPAPPRAPAISIHIGWERSAAKHLLTAFARDARLSRAEITEARGGIEAARRRFAKSPSPDLLVLDSAMGPSALMAELDPLLLHLEARTKVMVIGDANDVGLVRDLARRGIAYFLAPQPEDVIARICDVYAARDNARVIAVVGARGGVGASTLAHNIAWSIAERQQANTALVDLDLSFGVAGFDLDEHDAQSMGVGFLAPDLVDDVFLDRVRLKRSARLGVYAAPPSVAQPFDLEAEAVRSVIAKIRRTASFVVLDVPHHWAGWVKEVLVGADEVVIVASPDLASLRNAKNLMELLKAQRQKSAEPFYALSMTGAAKGPEISVRDYIEAMGSKPLAQFEFDPALFGMSAIKNKLLGEMAPRSKAAVTIDALAWVLTGCEPMQRLKKQDLLERVSDVAPSPQAALALEKIQRPRSFASPVAARAAAASIRPRGHRHSYASAQRAKTLTRRGAGGIRALLTVAAALVACVWSAQNPSLVEALGQAAGVLH